MSPKSRKRGRKRLWPEKEWDISWLENTGADDEEAEFNELVRSPANECADSEESSTRRDSQESLECWRCDRGLDTRNIIVNKRRESKASQIFTYDVMPRNYTRKLKSGFSNSSKRSQSTEGLEEDNNSRQSHSISSIKGNRSSVRTLKNSARGLSRSCRRKSLTLNEDILSSTVLDDAGPQDLRRKLYRKNKTGESIGQKSVESPLSEQIWDNPKMLISDAESLNSESLYAKSSNVMSEISHNASCSAELGNISNVDLSPSLKIDAGKCEGKNLVPEPMSLAVGDFVYLRNITDAEIEKNLWLKGNWRNPTKSDHYGKNLIGKRIRVWWDGDRCYYEGIVESFKPSAWKSKLGKHTVRYFSDGLVANEILQDPASTSPIPICEQPLAYCEWKNIPNRTNKSCAENTQNRSDIGMHWQLIDEVKRKPEFTRRNCLALTGSQENQVIRIGDNNEEEILETLDWALQRWHWQRRDRDGLLRKSSCTHSNFEYDKISEFGRTGDVMFIPIGRILEVEESEKEDNSRKILVARLWYPQDTYDGFDSSIHGLAELFEACRYKQNENSQVSSGDHCKSNLINTWLDKDGRLRDDMPISTAILDHMEEVKMWVPLSSPHNPARVHPCLNGRTNPCSSKAPQAAYQSDYFISHRYCLDLDIYLPMKNSTEDIFAGARPYSPPSDQPSAAALAVPKAKLLLRKIPQNVPRSGHQVLNEFYVCHRCRHANALGGVKKCSVEGCGRYFCQTCCALNKVEVLPLNVYEHEDWIGPCCQGMCSCTSCVRRTMRKIHAHWNAWVQTVSYFKYFTNYYSLASTNPRQHIATTLPLDKLVVHFCNSCGGYGPSSSMVFCKQCGISNHSAHCKKWTDARIAHLLAARGVSFIKEKILIPANEWAVGHSAAILLDNKWRAAVILAYRPLSKEHLFDIIPRKNENIPNSIWINLKSIEVFWEVIESSRNAKEVVDYGVSDEKGLRKVLRFLRKRKLQQQQQQYSDISSASVGYTRTNLNLSSHNHTDLNSQLWTCWACTQSKLNHFHQKMTGELTWKCVKSDEGTNKKLPGKWHFGYNDNLDVKNTKKAFSLMRVFEKLLDATQELPLQAFSLPDSFFCVEKPFSETRIEAQSERNAPEKLRRSIRKGSINSMIKLEMDIMPLDNDALKSEFSLCARCRPLDLNRRRIKVYSGPHMAQVGGNRVVNSGGECKDKGVKATSSRKDRMQRLDLRSIRRQGQGFDVLQSRKKRLRFGRSPIHAWGVFAEEPILLGDMVIEYRGEIIRNAIADKREKLYTKMQVGSDYMFRIDEDTVVDATFKGSLARFVNHSCDPNCYTQIIVVDGAKKIIIYAKRAIIPGEELTYDYKFPLEEKQENRVPCHCGTSRCNGFMN